MLGLRDSLIERNIQPVDEDTIKGLWDELGGDSLHRKIGVAGIKYLGINDDKDNVQIFVSQLDDSLKGLVRPLASKMRRIPGRHNFVIRLDADTISIDSISSAYKVALAKAGIEVAYQIIKSPSKIFYHHLGPLPPKPFEALSAERKFDLTKDTIRTETIQIGPLDLYYASFPGIRKKMIGEISPQIFFSVFITLITSISFVIIYRGMKTQQKLIGIKNDFINNVTHELKTPVATVSVAIEALQRFDVLDNPQLTQEYLGIAKQELERLTQMTDNILNTSVLESKAPEFIPERVNLDAIIQKIISRLKLIMESRGATVTYKKDGNDFETFGSPLHLTNLLHNLVDNALKYSPASPSIHIVLRQRDSRFIISVKDNGIGIPKEFQEKIFDKFFRIPTGDVHNTKGHGLGLSYVLNVVKSHNGKIEVYSEVNHGSEFVITLPRGSEFKFTLPRLLTHGNEFSAR
jgi:two-component system phosphate regulon sensor histidine kinase PhoR